MPERYYIPNNLDQWKWPRHINPHYAEVKAASAAWARSFGAFSPKAQEAYWQTASHLLRTTRCTARLRTGCDLMNMFFVFDEYSDVAHEDEVQVMADIGMDALRNPHKPRPKGEWVGGEVTRQFFRLWFSKLQIGLTSISGASKSIWKSEGTQSAPSHLSHPVIEELTILTIDMILLGNDIASYNLEQARGDDNHNMITIVMHNNKTDIQGAMNWVYDYHKELEAKFMDLYENKIPKFGEPVDTELAVYVDGLGNWVRASDQWGFESERYFGKKGPEIEKARWVTLLPKERSEDIGPQLVDDSLL